MRLKHLLASTELLLILIIVCCSIPPETLNYREIDHGMIVDSPSPNVMDAFTVSAYLRNNRARTVQVKSFRYEFSIVEENKLEYAVSIGVLQGKTLKIRPNETIILHKKTIYPDTNRTYFICVFDEVTTLTVEGWYTGLSSSNNMSKHGVNVSLDKYLYGVNEAPKITIQNNGESVIILGVYYGLEKFDNGTWRTYSPITPDGDLFTPVGIVIRSGGKYTHNIPISHLEDGYYRVKKTVNFGKGSLDYVVEFQKSKYVEEHTN